MDKDTPMSNADFSSGMNKLVNTWFKRWRDGGGQMTDAAWMYCIQELTDIHKEYPYQLIREIGSALVAELERRDKANAKA